MRENGQRGHVSCRREIGGLHLIGPRGRSGSQQMVPMSREQGKRKERKNEASHVFSVGPLHGQSRKMEKQVGHSPRRREGKENSKARLCCCIAREEEAVGVGLCSRGPSRLGAWSTAGGGNSRPGPVLCLAGRRKGQQASVLGLSLARLG